MANLNTNNKMCIFDLYFYIWTKDNVAPEDRGIFFVFGSRAKLARTVAI